MTGQTVFSFVRESVPLSHYVVTLPQVRGLHSVGGGKYRCNNVISGGDNTTSMAIDDNDGRFKMFSHGGESGDVITLYQLLNPHVATPRDAAIQLAQQMNVSIPDELLDYRNPTDSYQLTKACDELSHALHNYLMDSDNRDARLALEYLYDRGATEQMLVQWRIGLFPEDMSVLSDLISPIADLDTLEKIGVASAKRRGFIPMRGRITFPIFSVSGKAISFSSRAIDGIHTPLADSKYINTSTTPIYEKRATLYGQHVVKNRRAHTVIVCEGNMDVIALNVMCEKSEGVAAVATCGTALTREHIDILKKLNVARIVMAFDNDAAGKDAATGAVWVANHIDEVDYAAVSKGKDPWDLYVSGGSVDVSKNHTIPLIVAAANIQAERLERSDFRTWVSKTTHELVYTHDRALLIEAASDRAQITKAALTRELSTSQPQSAKALSPQRPHVELSPDVSVICQALLSLPMAVRREIAFSAITPALREHVHTVCGAAQDDDVLALDMCLGVKKNYPRKLQEYVFSIAGNDDDADVLCATAAQAMAVKLSALWATSFPDDPLAGRMCEVVSAIAAGLSSAPGVSQLSCMFDMASIE